VQMAAGSVLLHGHAGSAENSCNWRCISCVMSVLGSHAPCNT
jgi:hypothetical protein